MSTTGVKRTVKELLAVQPRNVTLEWLKQALQLAVELELSTLPPYLCARWSIAEDAPNTSTSNATERLKNIAKDEMIHMGDVANMLVAIGGNPDIKNIALSYPCKMPGGVHPETDVTLGALTEDQLRLFMTIEEPEEPLPAMSQWVEWDDTYATIGQFYQAILDAFRQLNPALSTEYQVSSAGAVVASIEDVDRTIKKIMYEGEGTHGSPTFDGKLAHHYQFGEILHRKKFIETEGAWGYTGPEILFPVRVYDLTGVAPDTDADGRTFNTAYTNLINLLHATWNGSPGEFGAALGAMFALGTPAKALMAKGLWPSFKLL
jgi:hypothetical protein